jgi:hypothetical protein
MDERDLAWSNQVLLLRKEKLLKEILLEHKSMIVDHLAKLGMLFV